MAIITISRQFGAGGRTLGKKLADRLGYTFADQEVIQMISEAANVSPGWVESVEREAGGKLSRIVNRMVNKSLVDRILSDERGYIDENIYLDYLVVIISQIAEEGNAVILGRGSQYILKDVPDAYHFLLVDSLEDRIEFMMDNYDLSAAKATSVIRSEDNRRRNFYKKLGKHNYDNPELYHLVINRSRVDMETTIAVIIDTMKVNETV